ncbi:MAG: hypothetical protein C0404_07175, partial [Verrucomicrobia bacterium]|nr:hypothetical protein [Verrucomicrobiota bacterium]
MWDTLECAWREVSRRGGRSLVTATGYALAVGIAVTLVCLQMAARNEASAVLTGTGTHFVAFVPACTEPCYFAAGSDAKGEGFVGSGGVLSALLPADSVDAVRRLPTVKHAAPYLLYRFRLPAGANFCTVAGFNPAD